jgi:hypothetical protein
VCFRRHCFGSFLYSRRNDRHSTWRRSSHVYYCHCVRQQCPHIFGWLRRFTQVNLRTNFFGGKISVNYAVRFSGPDLPHRPQRRVWGRRARPLSASPVLLIRQEKKRRVWFATGKPPMSRSTVVGLTVSRNVALSQAVPIMQAVVG